MIRNLSIGLALLTFPFGFVQCANSSPGDIIQPPATTSGRCYVPAQQGWIGSWHVSCKIADSCRGVRTVYGKFSTSGVLQSWTPTGYC